MCNEKSKIAPCILPIELCPQCAAAMKKHYEALGKCPKCGGELVLIPSKVPGPVLERCQSCGIRVHVVVALRECE